jgi:hypothetical protein
MQARASGHHIAHPAGVHALLGDAMMRGKFAEHWFDSLQWLYGGTGLGEAFSGINGDALVSQSADPRFATRERPIRADPVMTG